VSRLNYSTGFNIDRNAISLVFGVLSIATLVVLVYLLENLILSLLIVLAARLNNYSVFKFNVTQKSYLLNIPLATALLASFLTVLKYGDVLSFYYVYFIVFITVNAILLLVVKFDRVPSRSVSLFTAFGRNTAFHFLSIMTWIVYAEGHSVYLYSMLPADEYVFVNKFIRSYLLAVSAISIVPTVIWNRYGVSISRYDHILNNIGYWLLVLAFLLVVVYFSADANILINYFNDEHLIYLFCGLCIFSSYNLVVSQFLMRMNDNLFIFIVSLAECCGILYLYLAYKNVDFLLFGMLIIFIIKGVFFHLYWLRFRRLA
jgi:hypothetical protein